MKRNFLLMVGTMFIVAFSIVCECAGQTTNDYSATITADKMNTLYADLKNPITITSCDDVSKITVSFPECKVLGLGNGRSLEVVPPTSMIGKVVEATLYTPNGTVQVDFRVKKVPDPQLVLGSNIFGGRRSKAELISNPMLTVRMSEDFPFDIKWTVVSYSVDIIQKGILSTLNFYGGQFPQELIDIINNATFGTVFTFYNIKVSQTELGTRTLVRDITVRIK